jgi:hypothetical protein
VKYHIRRRDLPLAVYREVAAHLRQVTGVKTELIDQTSQPFDYCLSQVDRLQIEHPDDLDLASRQRLEQILAYYSDRYGVWETVSTVESGITESNC